MPGPLALQPQRFLDVLREGIQFGRVFIRQGEFPDSLNVLGCLTQGGYLGKDRTLRFRNNAQLLVRTTWPVGRS